MATKYDEFGKRIPEPDHEEVYRGIWIPGGLLRSVLRDMKKGGISSRAFVLLLTIDSLCHEQECRASNKYLARKMRLSPRQVKRLLQDLEQSGYIIRRTDRDHQRYLRTTWHSR